MGELSEEIALVDMDGVIANFIQGQIDSQGWDINHDQWTCWDFHKKMGLTNEQMWAPTRTPGWWSNLKVYDHAKELVSFIRETHKVVYCTSPSADHTCPGEKILWLRENGFMSWTKNDYQIGPNKELNAKSGVVLIDDSEDNRDKYEEHGGKFILFPQAWNENRVFIGDRLTYVKSKFKEMTGRS